MQADLLFFFCQRIPLEKTGGLGVNKRNRGYPADFEFIERPLNVRSMVKMKQAVPLVKLLAN